MPGIKNTTYKGFYAAHASGSGEGGWMLWSGSFFFTNSAGTRTDYTGVGIEAIGNSESYFRFSSSNGGNLDVRANKFFIGNPNLQFISGSASDIEISGSGFHIRPLSNGETEITASAGKIGEWVIKDGKLSGSNATLDANGAALYMSDKGPDTDSSAPFDLLRDEYYIDFTPADQGNTKNYYIKFGPNFAVDHSGTLHASGAVFEGTITSSIGLIGGWHIGTTKLSSSNLVIDSAGELRTSDFTSSLLPGSAGRGWRIKSSGEAEFENAQIRGTLNTAVFEKQSVNVVGGQLLVSNGTTVTGSSLVFAGTTTIPVKNADGFVVNEYIISKATGSTGFTTETMKITGVNTTSNPNTLTVTRNADGGGTIPTMSAGQVLASAGVSQSGYIHLNAAPSDAATPYIDIIERTGSNAQSIKRRARLGDLSGVAGEGPVPADPGFGLYSENVYLSGTITASAGKIADWEINSDFIRKVNGDNRAIIAADASQFSVNHAAKPALLFFNANASNKVMVNVGNIYKNSNETGFALFSDYNANTRVFQFTKNDNTHELTAQIAGWSFDTSEIKQANVTMSSAGLITAGNPAAQRIEINGTQASMSFFDGGGNTVMTLDDNIDGTNPGMSMTNGTILITGSTDYGDGTVGFSTVLSTVVGSSGGNISDSRLGAMFALSDGAQVNTDYTNFTTTFVDTCGTRDGGSGGLCYDVGAIVGSVHNAQGTVAITSGYGHDAYGIISRGIVADPSKNQQYSFFGEHGNLVNSQSAIIGAILPSTDFDHMLTVYEPVGAGDKGIGIVVGDSGAGYVHFMNSTTGHTADTDGWKIGMNSAEDFIILNEEADQTAFKIAEEDNEIWLGGRVTIGKDAVGTTETLPMYLDEADTSGGASALMVKASVNGEAAIMGAVGHNHQGIGICYVGQSYNVGGGIGFDGGTTHVDDGGIDDWSQDAVVLFRTDYNDSTNHDVIWWQYNSNNVSVRGTLTDGVSDERVKTNVKTIPNALDKILGMRGVTFDYNEHAYEMGYLSKSDWLDGINVKDNIGVIAQEVQKVLPEAVSPAPIDIDGSKGGYLTVQYDKLTAILIEGIKEQQGQIDELKKQIEEIKKCLPET
jgi:hypothetical protein